MAEAKLAHQLGLPHLPTGFSCYGVGDNPASDIRGARNAGPHWASILVRTGVWRGGENDKHDPADHVVQNVQEAVSLILAAAAVQGVA